ncbi:MAG: class I SAM-dependent methyltransferase [Burkholderiales bacterium]|nr:class I SAM-dependent methyltransferase [Burkholderiales bacterium]
MHNSTISHTSCLHHFRHQMPPKNIIVVGAGAGSWVNLLSEWEVGDAHFVEADKNQIQHLRSKLAKHATWQAHTAVMWHESAEISFYQAANPAENSSLPPDTLANLWPNFKTLGQEQRQTTTLNHLINEIQAETPPNWLIVDCLPALNIIQGAGAWLNHCEVIIARVLLSDKGFTGLNTSKEELDTYLNSQGFHFVSIQEERHPNIGNALYVRNGEQAVKHLAQSTENHALETEQTLININQTMPVLAENDVTAEELQDQLATMLNEKNSDQTASNAAITELKIQLENANILAAEFKPQLESTQQAKAAVDKTLLDHKAQLDAANLAKAEQQQRSEEHQTKLLEQNTLLETINASAAELKQQLANTQQAKAAVDKVLLENKAQLDAANLAKAAQQKLAEERQAKLLELQKQLDIALIAKTNSEKSLAEVKAQCDLLNRENENNIALDKKLDLLLTEQKNHSNHLQRNLFAEITRGLSNTAKQIESFMGVQNYLENGKSPLSFHGWPISPDIALFLLGKIEENNYDLIIEFGSGTSTVLFAKALLQKQKQLKIHNDNYSNQTNNDLINNLENADKVKSSAFKKIITIEHNKKYFDKTMDNLAYHELDQYVDLVHSPLVDYTYNNESYLYYSCTEKLEEIAKNLNGKTANILLLIDGPPGATGPLARFPAIPHVLKHLGHHKLSIVLDDYNRQEEKETAEKWKSIFGQRSIQYTEEYVACEKGAFFCIVNP